MTLLSVNPFTRLGANHDTQTQMPLSGLSHVRGATDPPLARTTVDGLLRAAVAGHGDSTAAVFRESGERLSWRQLADRVDRLAAGLLSLGLRLGDRVGIWAPNRLEWVVTQFATARIGAVLVNINPAYRLAELEYALNKVEVRVLITAARHKSSDYIGMLRKLVPDLDKATTGPLNAAALPHLEAIVGMGQPVPLSMIAFDRLCDEAAPAQLARLPHIESRLDCDEPINIQFTSGTTGAPKGATLSHYNIVNNAIHVARAMRLTSNDRLCIPVPLYHCFGMVLGVLACTSVGATMVFPSEGFDAGETLAALAEERCTAAHGVPTMFIAMLEHPDFSAFDLTRMRTGVMAGAPCPIETMRQVIDRMHMPEVTIAYGMTETSPVSFQSSIDDPLELRVATVGRVQPHLEVKIVDKEGRIVVVGESGELCTGGYSVMKGYWDDAPRTAGAVRAGWMYTGDLATIDEQGYCRIVGRVKDMIIRGGENVYPREVEEFLFRHPKVAQVQVFGIPDPRYGEEVCAWIVLKAGQSCTEDEIRAFCQDSIAHYKVPRHIRFVAEMPMTVTGKAQKFLMRSAMCKELGLSK